MYFKSSLYNNAKYQKLNIVKNTSEQYRVLLILVFTFVCVLPTLLPSGALIKGNAGNSGYGIIWFLFLYFFAGYIRVYKDDTKNNNKNLIKYFVFVILLFSLQIVGTFILKKFDMNIALLNRFYDYNSIFVFLSSLYLFLYFKGLNIKNCYIAKLVKYIAPYTLAVYIIHEQICIRAVLYDKILNIQSLIDKNYMIFFAIATVISIFIICIFIDIIRHKICEKLSHKIFVINIEKKLNNIFLNMICKLTG